jgi:tRNA (guanine-N7-)-methyltransferase
MQARYLSLTPLILWQRQARPLVWAQHFGREAATEVEIGFGNGEYLVRQAQQTPARNFVGIELEWGSILRCLRRLAQAQVRNVRVLQVDARVAMERLFPPHSLQSVRSLFPCPWPKERHVKHRLFSQAFLALLNSRLVPGGLVHIVTDHAGYAQWLLTQLPYTGFAGDWQPVPPGFRTKYERKWQAQGQEQFYEIRLQKQTSLQQPVHEDVAVQIHRIESFDPEAFHPTGARGVIAVEFKDFLFDPKLQRGMVWVFVTEDHLQQDFWIEIARGTGHWYIRPARGCAVVPTAGVQRALYLVRDAVRP